MEPESGPIGLQVDDVDSVIVAFIEWAGGPAEVRLLYTPDVLLAVETDVRRGFLLDEVYFATVWADRGRTELQASLADALEAAGKGAPIPAGVEPDPQGLIRGVLQHGRKIV